MPAAMIQGAPAYYWERDYDRITQALMGLNQMLDEQRQRKDRQKARDLAMLMNDPILAAGPAGRQFAEMYPDDPMAIAAVEGVARQGESQIDLEMGRSEYTENLFREHQKQAESAAEFVKAGDALQQAGDTLSLADAWAGVTPDPSLSPGARMAAEIQDRMAYGASQQDPRWEALLGVPDARRGLVAQDLFSKGNFPMPKILGMGMEGVDPKLAFGSQFLPPEDTYSMFRQQAGLEPSANVAAQIASTEAGRTSQAEMAQAEYERRLQLEKERRITKQAIPGKAGKEAEAAKGSSGITAVAKDLKEQDKAAAKTNKKATPTAPPATVTERAKVDVDRFGWDSGTAAQVFSTIWQDSLQKAGGDSQKAATIFAAAWARATAAVTAK